MTSHIQIEAKTSILSFNATLVDVLNFPFVNNWNSQKLKNSYPISRSTFVFKLKIYIVDVDACYRSSFFAIL